MKPALTSLCVLLLASVISVRADLILKPNDCLAICGDTITERKVYSVFMEDYLLMCQPVGIRPPFSMISMGGRPVKATPVSDIRIIQFGGHGEAAPVFDLRIQRDVLPFKPTVATLSYGMVDGMSRAMTPSIGNNYRQGLQKAVDLLKAGGVRDIVIGSPGAVDTDVFKLTPAEVYNQTLDSLRGIAQEVAQKNGLIFADLHTPMMDIMAKAKVAYGQHYPVAGDGSSLGTMPNDNGQLIMAWAFLKALGCDGAIGTITLDLDANNATCTPDQKIISCDKGTVTLISTRYPFCFQGDPMKASQLTASLLRFFPFNDDLNRYMLVAKGLKGSKAKVTWGNQTKEFATADLQKGVNLAAEFMTNPFSAQFDKVSAAVKEQQTLETTLIKTFLPSLPVLKQAMPDQAAALDQVAAAAIQRDKTLFDAAQALVIPIQHTIHIDPEP